MPVLSKPIQIAMAWCGPIFVAVFFGGLIIAGFFPPIPPDHTAAEVARQYQEHTTAIRLGCMIMMIAVAFTIPFWAVLSAQLVRIEGKFSPICFANVACGAIGVLAATFPLFAWSAAAFRPERADVETTQALNDLGWFPFIMNWPFASAQAVLLAVAIFADRNIRPVFPRWVGYYLMWCAIGFIPAGFLTFFKDGPFAWNGLLSFWLAATFFGTEFLILSWATVRAIKNQYAGAEEAGLPPATAVDGDRTPGQMAQPA